MLSRHMLSSKNQLRPKEDQQLCYLCGKMLCPPINADHVPLKGLIAPQVRKQHNLDRLLTIPVHKECNSAYSRDEEYFVATTMPFSRGSAAGDAIYLKYLDDYRSGRKAKLLCRVLREFEPQPSGLTLPPGKVIKRQDGARVARVSWKIVRGLYFHHHGIVLPGGLNTSVTMTPPGEPLPEAFTQTRDLPDDLTHGRYPGIFDYRFRSFELEGGKLNYWGMLLWDRVILTVAFHDPWLCDCANCVAGLAEFQSV